MRGEALKKTVWSLEKTRHRSCDGAVVSAKYDVLTGCVAIARRLPAEASFIGPGESRFRT